MNTFEPTDGELIREKNRSRTHHWRDLSDGSKQEPNDTLKAREHVGE